MKKSLRYGYTTGACAAAAAKGAALLLRDGKTSESVMINLPSGEEAHFTLHTQSLGGDFATCSVIKDAGDDPDITNGAEIAATVTRGNAKTGVVIEGGTGVGRVTKPGLAVPVGEWAINPVPRRMIEDAVRSVYDESEQQVASRIVISIPNGEELARKTLNARLGIVGGLSILGTTGIVKPVSAQAWTDTIETAIDVAIASGSDTVVFSTGRSSEMVAQSQLRFNEEAFVMMGDHVGHALRACSAKGVGEAVLACQFAKLLKIACGHEQTHAASSELDLQTLAAWVTDEPRISSLAPLVRRANTARQVLEESGNNATLINLVCGRAKVFAQTCSPQTGIKVFLAGYRSEVLYFG